MNNNLNFGPPDEFVNAWVKTQARQPPNMFQEAPPMPPLDSPMTPLPETERRSSNQPQPPPAPRYPSSGTSPRYAKHNPYNVNGWSGITYVEPEDEVTNDGTHTVTGKLGIKKPFPASPRHESLTSAPRQVFEWPAPVLPMPSTKPEKYDNGRRERTEAPLMSPRSSVVPGFIATYNKKNEERKSIRGEPLGWFYEGMIGQYSWAIVEWEDYEEIIIVNDRAYKTGKLTNRGRGVLILNLRPRPTLNNVHPEKVFEVCARYGAGDIRWFPNVSLYEARDHLRSDDKELLFNGTIGCTHRGKSVWISYHNVVTDSSSVGIVHCENERLESEGITGSRDVNAMIL